MRNRGTVRKEQADRSSFAYSAGERARGLQPHKQVAGHNCVSIELAIAISGTAMLTPTDGMAGGHAARLKCTIAAAGMLVAWAPGVFC